MDALDMLARIYWYTIEFGLVDDHGVPRVFGAGIVSSAGETVFSVEDADVLRLRFDPVRIMRTAYRIDDFQPVYFVLDSTEQLLTELVALDFGPIYEAYRADEPLAPDRVLPGDRVYRGTARTMGEAAE
jgi:phenylalanine-4-hydroxylase